MHPYYSLERLILTLVKISKDEAIALRKAFPDLTMTRTVRQKSNRGYFVEESARVVQFLEKFWNEKIVERLLPDA